jgi:hypothetical protein
MSRARAAETAGRALAVVAVAAWLALVEVFWLPLRVAGVLVPLSVMAAVAVNLLLPEAARRWSGSRVVALLPGIVWLAVALAAMVRRPEGDLILTGGVASGVVNLAFLMAGTLAAAVGTARVLARGAVDRRAVDRRA